MNKMVEAPATTTTATASSLLTNHHTTTTTCDTSNNISLIETECLKLISCDAIGCTRKNPIHPCTNCQCHHYCSPTCQNNHWQSAHSYDCPNIDDMRAGFAGIGNESLLTPLEPDAETIRQVLDAKPSCGICLAEEMEHPIVLQTCHHAFCFGCLKQWNEHESCLTMAASDNENNNNNCSRSTCPLCRQPFPELVDTIFTNSLLHLTLAGTTGVVSEKERDEHFAAATEEINKVRCMSDLTEQERIHADMILGETALMMADYETALGLFRKTAQQVQVMVERQQWIQTLMSRFRFLVQDPANNMAECERIRREAQSLMQQDNKAHPTDHVVVLLKIGRIQCLQGEWYNALLTYQDICSRYPEQSTLTESQQREMFASLAQVAYHLGHYDRAIYCGEATVAMNRYYAWSHKYLALAHKAAGNANEARQIAAEAVIHETPWDGGHRAEVQRWYQETFRTTMNDE